MADCGEAAAEGATPFARAARPGLDPHQEAVGRLVEHVPGQRVAPLGDAAVVGDLARLKQLRGQAEVGADVIGVLEALRVVDRSRR